jgi:hypothetical protein
MNIYIIYNYWELLLSLIILEQSKSKDNILIISGNEIDNEILIKLEKYYKFIKFNFKSNKFIKLFTFYYKINYFLPKKLNSILINSRRIISFSDQDVVTRYFIKNKKNIDLYEHGSVNYQENFDDLTQKIKSKIFGMEKPYGRNKYIKNIYLRGTGKIPKDIEDKVVLIDIEYLWSLIEKESEDRIFEIFGLDSEEIKKVRSKEIILFTQPFSEDNVLSEKEKIELYKHIIENYNIEKLLIKSHPREKTNYKKEFPKITVIDQRIPSELLLFTKANFSRVVTVFSTSISIFLKKSEVDFYGTEAHPKLFKYYGNVDFFFKKNK